MDATIASSVAEIKESGNPQTMIASNMGFFGRMACRYNAACSRQAQVERHKRIEDKKGRKTNLRHIEPEKTAEQIAKGEDKSMLGRFFSNMSAYGFNAVSGKVVNKFGYPGDELEMVLNSVDDEIGAGAVYLGRKLNAENGDYAATLVNALIKASPKTQGLMLLGNYLLGGDVGLMESAKRLGFNLLKEGIKLLRKPIKSLMNKLWEWTPDKFKSIWDTTSKVSSKVFDLLSTGANKLSYYLRDISFDLDDEAKQLIENNDIENNPEASSTFSGVFSSLISKGSSALSSFKSGLTAAASSIKKPTILGSTKFDCNQCPRDLNKCDKMLAKKCIDAKCKVVTRPRIRTVKQKR